VPIAEAMVALVLADHLLRQRTARLEWDEDEVE
jgi:chorismate synthase